MLLDFATLYQQYDLHVNGVLHVGAHLGEEAEDYDELGIKNVVWIEANPAVIARIADHVHPYGHHVMNALITDKVGETRRFNITNADGLSSSVLEFGTHQQTSPDMVFESFLDLPTTTLDQLMLDHPVEFNGLNMLSMDIQGAELMALRGATRFLTHVDVVMSEVNNRDVYIGCAKVWELDEILERYGLTRVETMWVGGDGPEGHGWGDALWCRQ